MGYHDYPQHNDRPYRAFLNHADLAEAAAEASSPVFSLLALNS
jgi:hypothetical protein